MIGVPDAFALPVGGRVEPLLRGAFTAVCVLAAVAMFAPASLPRDLAVVLREIA
jgi:hypothetical protein